MWRCEKTLIEILSLHMTHNIVAIVYYYRAVVN